MTPPRPGSPGWYHLHGLCVRSDLALPGVPPDRLGPPDLTILGGPARPVPEDPPAGRLLAGGPGAAPSAAESEVDGTVTLRIPGRADLVLSPDRSRLTIAPDPSLEAGAEGVELLGLLAIGAGISLALMLGGACVLHASAVSIDGRALALVGPSGSGKSTGAAWLCREEGAGLLTDDVLRIDWDADRPWCAPGTTEIRLRPGAAALADAVAPDQRRVTADGRTAVSFTPADRSLPLGAIALPRPGPRLQARRLRGAEALVALTRARYTLAWRDAGVLRRRLAHLARLADQVPVVDLVLPPPERLGRGPGLAEALLAAAGSDSAAVPA